LVQQFSHNVANKEINKQTNKQTKKSLDYNTPYRGRGNENREKTAVKGKPNKLMRGIAKLMFK